VFGSSGSEEVVDLLVDIAGALEILGTANLSLSQAVAVDGSGDSGGVHIERSQLLPRRLLTGGSKSTNGITSGSETHVRSKLQIASPSNDAMPMNDEARRG
jgi:hypothetical protein